MEISENRESAAAASFESLALALAAAMKSWIALPVCSTRSTAPDEPMPEETRNRANR